jgi:hypothetical protein
MLIERAGALGGTATTSLMSLIVTPFDALHGFAREFFSLLAEGRGSRAFGDAIPWDPEAYKLLTAQLCLEAGVDVLLYTTVASTVTNGHVLRGVITENKSGRQAYLARTVIDATGDGDVLARAGGEFVVGRESDRAMRPVTVMGRLANVNLLELKKWMDNHEDDLSRDRTRRIIDIEGGIVRVDGFYSVIDKAKEIGLLSKSAPINYIRFSGLNRTDPEHTDLICNTTRIYGVDATDGKSISDAEITGRLQLEEIVASIKALLPGFEQSYLVETSSQLGVRETRRAVGRYTVTWDDIDQRRRFDDSIATIPSRDYGSAGVHEPDEGSEGRKDDEWARKLEIGTVFFEFPYRALVPVRIKGLLMAGRCASMTHDADRFVRGQHSVVFLGQAAGTAGAMAARLGMDCGDVPVADLQEELRGAGVRLHDEDPAIIAQ